MTQKEEAVSAARRYANKSGKYAMYMAPYGPLDGDIISMVAYTSTPQISLDRSILVCARTCKKGYLSSKGRINEAKYYRDSRIVNRQRVPGTHHIELVTVKLIKSR